MAELVKIYPENPNPKAIQKVIDVLKKGGVIIYPTDTVYSFGCDITKSRALEQVARLKNIKIEKANFSIIFSDLSHLSEYTKQVDTPTYKLLNRALPGPYTFILDASNAIPKIFKSKKKTIGIRIPDNNIPREIVRALGNPIIASSVHDEDEIINYTTDPELILEKYGKQVDLIIDGGMGDNHDSTVIDLTLGSPEVIREGKGDLSIL
ncbi:L-threonylcarbamoyladenylate synthase [Owenweeksia hongkongensis]|uniref:Sua5/YciO/YrdC/YwlC family protein n=1 Tax=Owenweeksia hongkongensis (strain DSM 17368 / CIP 108786 / JCM 12287 / NRRL B-23963 / UST20020801) TaxID=926562 RepID=G8R2R5_OWEHD|nr:L-threonylcarbamoyladenylate synthase [Owenweeksia hongkongensis]AEV31870.1 Sua5/YciO/YrdC/YwlC family protein [Owenweeksia hongkongensis DSM 17368]